LKVMVFLCFSKVMGYMRTWICRSERAAAESSTYAPARGWSIITRLREGQTMSSMGKWLSGMAGMSGDKDGRIQHLFTV
jgi:hypothetical protein